MAVGGFAVDAPSNAAGDAKITLSVVITCIVAASSGLIFGYDIGISGGVTTMGPFLKKFFPAILKKAKSAETNIYCVYDSQILTLFTSSLYLAGLVSSLVASRVTTMIGRRNIMLLGGCTFLIGGAINGGAQNIAMLILGRILLGLGVGFTNQAAPVYLSEIAPPKWRGAFNTGFQFFIAIGVVIANCLNYVVSNHSWGWRVSLGFAVVPAAAMTIGAFFITDTPNSLVQRGKIDEARNALRKVRKSTADVDAELDDLIKMSEKSKALQQEPFTTIFEGKYRPHLVMAFCIPFFQQLTGINVVAFYSANLFQSVGLGNNAALLSTIVLGVVNLVSIMVSTFIVDRFGRRLLFLEGGVHMLICQIAVAVLLALSNSTQHLPQGNAISVLVFLCLYAAGFGWSWGPLSWLVPSEIFPMKIRSTGQSISVAVNFVTTFVLSQTFLTMLCHFRYGAFLFFAGWIAVMTIFVWLLLPETKGIPLESMYAVWQKHWFWHRFVVKDDVYDIGLSADVRVISASTKVTN